MKHIFILSVMTVDSFKSNDPFMWLMLGVTTVTPECFPEVNSSCQLNIHQQFEVKPIFHLIGSHPEIQTNEWDELLHYLVCVLTQNNVASSQSLNVAGQIYKSWICTRMFTSLVTLKGGRHTDMAQPGSSTLTMVLQLSLLITLWVNISTYTKYKHNCFTDLWIVS